MHKKPMISLFCICFVFIFQVRIEKHMEKFQEIKKVCNKS